VAPSAGGDDVNGVSAGLVKLMTLLPLATAMLVRAVLLPGVLSFVAPVDPVTVTVPAAVGVPEIGHVIELPAASDATGVVGLQVPRLTPAGSPETLHVALVAAAPPKAFLHTTLPE